VKERPLIAGIGEVLWDVLPSGKMLGGAPCNFVYHATQAGCEGYVISAVGKDNLGDELLVVIQKLMINSRFIQVNDFPTGTVTVELSDWGQPSYTIHENVAWDHIQMLPEIIRFSRDFDAVCFGSLSQRNIQSERSIQSFLSSLREDCLKVFDINLRKKYYSKGIIERSCEMANIVKLNEDELPVISEYFGFEGVVEMQLKQLLSHFSLRYVVYTKGEKGSIIMGNDEYSYLEAPKVVVTDTVGAGDAFAGILIAGLLQGFSLRDVHKIATDLAAYVCIQKGATPDLRNKIF
jgi:fructokinase